MGKLLQRDSFTDRQKYDLTQIIRCAKIACLFLEKNIFTLLMMVVMRMIIMVVIILVIDNYTTMVMMLNNEEN